MQRPHAGLPRWHVKRQVNGFFCCRVRSFGCRLPSISAAPGRKPVGARRPGDRSGMNLGATWRSSKGGNSKPAAPGWLATLRERPLMARLVMWLTRRWITRHLEQMARYARSVSLTHLGEPLKLDRRPAAVPDELDQVAAALNDMSQALAAEFECRNGIDAERLRLIDAYERHRALLRAIVDNSPAVISVKDLDGRYLLVNRRCEERHRMSADAIVGKTDHDLFPPELADRLRRNDLRVIDARMALQEEEMLPLPGGICTVLAARAPLYDDKGELYAVCGVQTDITERKGVERELQHYRKHLEVLVADRTADLQRANSGLKFMNLRLQQAQMQLVQSEKMASVGVLAAGVAHEINNPIGFVSANLGT